jgi:hypothetical protein
MDFHDNNLRYLAFILLILNIHVHFFINKAVDNIGEFMYKCVQVSYFL